MEKLSSLSSGRVGSRGGSVSLFSLSLVQTEEGVEEPEMVGHRLRGTGTKTFLRERKVAEPMTKDQVPDQNRWTKPRSESKSETVNPRNYGDESWGPSL
jgi:hypothetical protein